MITVLICKIFGHKWSGWAASLRSRLLTGGEDIRGCSRCRKIERRVPSHSSNKAP